MNHFLSINDVTDVNELIKKSMAIKESPLGHMDLGKGKTLGLVFFNSSLRTRMSMTLAAYNLGMNVMVLNVSSDSWQLEFEDGTRMDGGTAEHIKEAVPVLSSYCDVIGVRSFPGLINREEDYSEKVINAFKEYGGCPVINLESATVHPLQSLTDMVTIEESKIIERPKVVITWAPHVKALPQAVSNSFLQWADQMDFDLTVTHPEGLDLANEFVGSAHVEYDQKKALEGADIVYVKNWSSYQDYGKVIDQPDWEMTLDKLMLTNNAKLMHCLPVRRNLVISDDALDSHHSIVLQQAENRLYTAQAVLKEILGSIK
ncbi:MAG: N-acetylornithine carbamoyltransferase [Bacteroidota bacterium]